MFTSKHKLDQFPEASAYGTSIRRFASSQLILLKSRKKNALVYTLATIVGIFCTPGGFPHFISSTDPGLALQRAVPLPLMTFLMVVGLYVFNDLSDVNIDRINGKKRPIPMGLVTRAQTIAFVTLTNVLAIILGIITENIATIVFLAPMVGLGVLYSAPKIALKDRFIVKTFTIASFMALCVFLGTTVSGNKLGASAEVPVFGAIMVALMIFVTSPLNDMGDVRGDLQAGRRTIPIVIGEKKTLTLIGAVAVGMCALSWVFSAVFGIGIGASVIISGISFIVLLSILRIHGSATADILRKYHSRLVPLHFLLHLAIVVGAIFII